jgi:hypothetical protein
MGWYVSIPSSPGLKYSLVERTYLSKKNRSYLANSQEMRRFSAGETLSISSSSGL